ncbi:helix-turn-helix domain-containing protein [Pseudomonas resinovorans]|uniref:Helix-turn-helix domain-containing protein n=1 Tax=Metapseudomonas resinovorans TaxID=53412 RepID=A0ABT4Y6W4_METRE|nr:helix-turn-helix transcriptional regulator [Pseudomonas resinovorans]MDA8484610.1 helix-turn-helix domain-containing protein [Pseudomonas resinovorans]
MNEPTSVQIINGPDGKPAFVVIPYEEYIAQRRLDEDLIPHDVVSRMVDGATAIRAWREHLGLTQTEVADRMGITQSAYAQQESSSRPRKATRERIAKALGIAQDQLSI